MKLLCGNQKCRFNKNRKCQMDEPLLDENGICIYADETIGDEDD